MVPLLINNCMTSPATAHLHSKFNALCSHSMNYDSFKESYANKEAEETKSLPPGTRSLCDIAVAKAKRAKKPDALSSRIAEISPRVIAGVFCAMAINSALNDIVVAVKWASISILLSIFVIGKEVFGFLISFKPGMLAMFRRPTPRVLDGMNDPFVADGLLSGLTLTPSVKESLAPWIQTYACLSNLRAAWAQAIAFRWGVGTPYLAHEVDLQKIGNLAIVAIDLVIKTRDENKVVNFWLFSSFFVSMFFLCLGFVGHYSKIRMITRFVNELQDGKVSQNEVMLALEGVYNIMNGEDCDKSFGQAIEEANAKQEKQEKEGEAEEEKESEVEKPKEEDEVAKEKTE